MILYKSWMSEALVRVKLSRVEVKWFSCLLKKCFGLTGILLRFSITCRDVTLLFVWDNNTFFLHIFFSFSPLGKQPCGHCSCSQHPHKKQTAQRQSRHTKMESGGAVEAVGCEVLPEQDEHCPLFSTTKTMRKHNPNLRQWTLEFKCLIISFTSSKSVYGY